jgi:hypothetical protein
VGSDKQRAEVGGRERKAKGELEDNPVESMDMKSQRKPIYESRKMSKVKKSFDTPITRMDVMSGRIQVWKQSLFCRRLSSARDVRLPK